MYKRCFHTLQRLYAKYLFKLKSLQYGNNKTKDKCFFLIHVPLSILTEQCGQVL